MPLLYKSFGKISVCVCDWGEGVCIGLWCLFPAEKFEPHRPQSTGRQP